MRHIRIVRGMHRPMKDPAGLAARGKSKTQPRSRCNFIAVILSTNSKSKFEQVMLFNTALFL
jgi:hypothetical protein